MIGFLIFGLFGGLAAISDDPTIPYEDVTVTSIPLAEGIKAFDTICLGPFPNEAGFQSAVQASPLNFKPVTNSASSTHNAWRSEFALVIFVRQDRLAPLYVLPQCNVDFLADQATTDDDVIKALDHTLESRLGAVPSRQQLEFGIRWKWRQDGHSVHLDLIRNERTKPGQVSLSLQPN